MSQPSHAIQPRTFIIETVKDAPLKSEVQLAFIITPTSDGKSTKSFTPVAWELVSFKANEIGSKSITWHPGRHMSIVTPNGVSQDLVSSEISPSNYVEFLRPKWATHPFFDGDENKIIAINNSPVEQQFVLGTRAKGSGLRNGFQPFGVLRKLNSKEGLATEIPGYIHAYSVRGFLPHRRITDSETAKYDSLLVIGFNVSSLQLTDLPEQTHWYLRTNTNGKAELVKDLDPKTDPSVSPKEAIPPVVPANVLPQSLKDEHSGNEIPATHAPAASQPSKASAKTQEKPTIPPKPVPLSSPKAKVDTPPVSENHDTPPEPSPQNEPLPSQSTTEGRKEPDPVSPPASRPTATTTGPGDDSQAKQDDPQAKQNDPVSPPSPQPTVIVTGHPIDPKESSPAKDDKPAAGNTPSTQPVVSVPKVTPNDISAQPTPPGVSEPDQGGSSTNPPLNDLLKDEESGIDTEDEDTVDSVPGDENKDDSDEDSGEEDDEDEDEEPQSDVDSRPHDDDTLSDISDPSITTSETSKPAAEDPQATPAETVDLKPLRDALLAAANAIDQQIPFKDVLWGKQVLAQFAPKVMPLLSEFERNASTWSGYHSAHGGQA